MFSRTSPGPAGLAAEVAGGAIGVGLALVGAREVQEDALHSDAEAEFDSPKTITSIPAAIEMLAACGRRPRSAAVEPALMAAPPQEFRYSTW